MAETREFTRMLVILDAQSIPVARSRALELSGVIDGMVRRWFPRARLRLESRAIRRVYSDEGSHDAAAHLGARAGWRRGGTGYAEDVVHYIASDARAFSLERPQETALVLCTDNPVFERLIEELCAEGVNLRLVSGAGGPRAELVAELGNDEVATLPRVFA